MRRIDDWLVHAILNCNTEMYLYKGQPYEGILYTGDNMEEVIFFIGQHQIAFQENEYVLIHPGEDGEDGKKPYPFSVPASEVTPL